MPPGFAGFVEPGLSFSPEKTQIEFACEVAAKFSVPLPGGPITSLAKAALALAPARAAVQTATASNGFLRIAYLPSRDPVASQASSGPVRGRPYSDPAGSTVTLPTQHPSGKGGSQGCGRRLKYRRVADGARRKNMQLRDRDCPLPQPGGFEGLLFCLVERERRRLAVPNRDQPGSSSLNLDAVSSPQVCEVLHDQDAVLDLHWVIDLEPNFVECLKEPPPEGQNLAVPPKDACIESAGVGPVQHGVRRPVLQDPVEVTPVVRIGASTHDLDVSCDIAR